MEKDGDYIGDKIIKGVVFMLCKLHLIILTIKRENSGEHYVLNDAHTLIRGHP